MTKIFFRLLLLFFIINFFKIEIAAMAQKNKKNDLPINIKKMIDNGGVLISDKYDNIIYSYNADTKFIPASIIKILTSYFALKILGVDFCFYTDIYFDEKTTDLFVRGYGDPFFVSERMAELANEISKKYKKINNIYVDDSFFDDAINIPGVSATLNPYDTQNGALTVNFNTVAVKYENGEYFSNEQQTPMTEFIKKYLNSINFKGNERINIGKNRDYPELYFGELLKEFLKQNNIEINGTVSKKNIPGNLKNYFRFYSSETLESLIQKLNKYSNNFMINQIFLYIGALKTQAPANLSKSVIVFKEIFKNDRILNDIEIEEASGLSRQNKISCAQSNYVLKLFEQYKKLLPERVGGLFKTGTLNGVYSISGYYNSKKYGDVYITIILNQQRNTRQKILDELLKLID